MNCRHGIAVTAIQDCIDNSGVSDAGAGHCMASLFKLREERSIMKKVFEVLALIVVFASVVRAQDPGWPREKTLQGAKLIYYQPQIDDWKDYRQLDARMAISLTPSGGKPVVGMVALRA